MSETIESLFFFGLGSQIFSLSIAISGNSVSYSKQQLSRIKGGKMTRNGQANGFPFLSMSNGILAAKN